MHRECPLCGETMRLREAETRDHIGGAGSLTPRMGREWVCPECDYFEELDEESARGN